MKKFLLSSLFGALVLAGCTSTQPTQTLPDYQAQDKTGTESMMEDSTMMGETNDVSKSTELDDIDKELQGTTISEEDFSDL